MKKNHTHITAFLIFLAWNTSYAAETILPSPFAKTEVIATYAKPGDFVKEGQLLARLDTNLLKEKLALLKAKKKHLEDKATHTHRYLNALSTQRDQRLDDQKQSSINTAQLLTNGSNGHNITKNIANNLQIKKDISALSTSQQKHRHALLKQNNKLQDIAVAEIQLEDLMTAAEITAPKNGRLIKLAQPSTTINQAGEMIGIMQDV